MKTKYFSIMGGRQGNGIFYGTWDQIKPLVVNVAGCKQAKSAKSFEAAKKNFYAKFQININQYFKFVETIWHRVVVNLSGESSDEEKSFKDITEEDEFVAHYLLSGVKADKRVDFSGCRLIHLAAKHNFTRAIQLLLADGANINAVNHGNESSLHTAAYHGHAASVSLLIEKGADTNLRLSSPRKELAVHLLRTLCDHKLACQISQYFMKISAGYFTVIFDPGPSAVIRCVEFHRRYTTNTVASALQKKHPEYFVRDITRSSGFQIKKHYHLCHKQGVVDLKNVVLKKVLGKSADALPKSLNMDCSEKIPRLKAVELISRYYKELSSDSSNYFIDLKDRNGAFGFLAATAVNYKKEQGGRLHEINVKHLPYLSVIKEIKEYIVMRSGKSYLTVNADNVETIFKAADLHYAYYQESNSVSADEKKSESSGRKRKTIGLFSCFAPGMNEKKARQDSCSEVPSALNA